LLGFEVDELVIQLLDLVFLLLNKILFTRDYVPHVFILFFLGLVYVASDLIPLLELNLFFLSRLLFFINLLLSLRDLLLDGVDFALEVLSPLFCSQDSMLFDLQ